MIISILRYYTKYIFSLIILNLGGVFLLKKIFKNKKALLIINYHNFSKYNNYRIRRGGITETHDGRNFNKQMLFFKKHFNFSYPNDFFEGNCDNGINVLITFDDGYKDNYDIALPILKRHNASAIFFLATDFINTDEWLWHDKAKYLLMSNKISSKEVQNQLTKMNQGISIDTSFVNLVEQLFNLSEKRLMLNWYEAGQLVKNGFLVGGHTATHKVLSLIDKGNQHNEIESSLNTINKHLNIHPLHFAYPNGLFNEVTLNLMIENNIQYAYTTKSGINFIEDDSNLQLKRIGVNCSDSIGIILLKILFASIK
tara:strand:- start:3289 stop:4224 length:936 start_codon:yes stop_codon:yes gene_type:complete